MDGVAGGGIDGGAGLAALGAWEGASEEGEGIAEAEAAATEVHAR